ncbi:uncharacterized protein F4807DRAFT_462197 [Annulohypoxylon truncatum]|uniref:uncharacterized protein n=1 Tax=Annulohypoxylon truncatum TaxID=327061 RepID=UPI002007B9F7|nr:uncharacterized protein F4807DRAFT_462197 [Annulohypoxylon truncatum]KAI1207753.1 hypothetical protein F4807DRAFT_462197 [Annulohypoxylon truncatum]
MDKNRNKPIQDEHTNISKPQIFVQLAFGVSWSQRHTPQTHTVTYMSRNLKNARDSGNFPRQVPPPTTNYLAAPESRQNRSREHSGRYNQERQQHRHHHHHHGQQSRAVAQSREHGRPRGQTNDQPSEHLRARPRSGSRNEGRGLLHERGRSAPPPFNDSPWDVHHVSSATLFPPFAQTSREQPEGRKALPAPPSQYRLGEDGLPWSAWAWPADDDSDSNRSPYANNPTTVPLSMERSRSEDLERARELESLSAAMVTVDNGFENQWWYQGQREPVEPWWPQEAGGEADEAGTLTTAEALLLSDSEPPLALSSNEDHLASLHDLVSPMSDTSSPAQSFARPLYRSLTTRSEELWLGS